MMRRVHDKARVHVALGMMGVAALGMFANAIIGKSHWLLIIRLIDSQTR